MRTRGLFAILILLTSPAALAQTDDDLAKQYYQLGEKLYNRSDYEGALVQFQKAYQHSKRPAFLYNMARCYEFSGQLKQAIEHYEKFLEAKPPNAKIVQARIANLKRKLADKTKPPGDKPPGDKPPGDKPPGETKPPKDTTPPPPPPPRVETRSRWKQITGWVLVGAGGGALIAGISLGLAAKNMESDLLNASKNNQPYADWRSKEEQGETLEKLQIVTLAVGGAAILGGALLVYLDMREEKQSRRAWITPTLTPGGAFVSGGWRF